MQERSQIISPSRTCSRTLLFALLIAFSFMFTVVPADAWSGATDIHESSSIPSISDSESPYEDSLSGYRSGPWDWRQFADDAGMVDVIVTYDESSGPASELIDLLSPYETARYHLAIDGFAARVSADLLYGHFSESVPGMTVYPDMKVQATLATSVVQIGADSVWAMRDSSGYLVNGRGMVVAVLDTGVDYTHPDLGGGFGPGYKVIGGYDFYNNDNNPMDDNGHGTHVAGIIAANGGTKGVAPGASILAYKVLDRSGSGSMGLVISAIEAAMDPNGDGSPSDRADVISMSLGGSGSAGDPVCQAVKSATEEGIVVCAAAGNSGPGMGTVASPGISEDAITVGAIDSSGELAVFSSRGVYNSLQIKPDISAPGVGIVSTVPYSGTKYSSSTGYTAMSGTSMAAPHVSGAAALLLQLHPDWNPAKVKSAMISGSNLLNESLWQAGSGGLWVPGASGAVLFAEESIVSYGLASDPVANFLVRDSGYSISVSSSSSDRYSMSADGAADLVYWSNASAVSPTSFTVAGSTGTTVQLSLPRLSDAAPEGYYEGSAYFSSSRGTLRVPFGYALLSRLNVKVLDMAGNEVFDAYGGVWVYDVPKVHVAVGIRADSMPSPPATFMLPSGEYSVHAAGHQLIYTYSDPYVLSTRVVLGKTQSVNVTLRMSEAREMTLDLRTPEGKPIYVKDYRLYCRYVGVEDNVSFHLVGSDYSVLGEEFLTVPITRKVFVSDTEATVGLSIAGFSYSPSMWEFMKLNWKNWRESTLTTGSFYMESTADLQYLLSWEFPGISSSTSLALGLDPSKASVYRTKYDIPGAIGEVWGNWGTHLSMGGDSSFYMRRDTDTSLNTFFSGITRTTTVQGVFSESYFYGSLFKGYFVRELYDPDYSHIVKADTISEIYLPDRNYLLPVQGENLDARMGAGPVYPSLRTANTESSLVLFHPLLRDQSGANVGGMNIPSMKLYKNGGMIGIYQLSEYLARMSPERIVSLSGSGTYVAQITYDPLPEICNRVLITLGFTVPGTDLNPPQISGLSMSQRFVPGSAIPVALAVSDDNVVSKVEISWKSASVSTWTPLTVTNSGQGVYSSTIQTSAAESAIDLKFRATDGVGNYLEYTANNASKKQLPVDFVLSADTQEIGYQNGEVVVVLTGLLKNPGGAPLCPTAAVPLELMHNGKKIGIILDEYITSSSHTHNGNIRFEWHLNPTTIFTGPGQVAKIDVVFDLGLYEVKTRSLTFTSIVSANAPPTIALQSPLNGSMVSAGDKIVLDVTDDGTFTVTYSLDGVSKGQLASPYEIDTSSWSEGPRVLDVTATDDQLATSSASFSFTIDAFDPVIHISYPTSGSLVPVGSVLLADVSDRYLSSVRYIVDGGTSQNLPAPYSIDMTGWALGTHSVTIVAADFVGRTTQASVSFEIVASTVIVRMASPSSGDVIRSGTALEFAVEGRGAITVIWSEGGAWRSLLAPYLLSTSGWSEGRHDLIVNASDDLGGSYEISVSVNVDDTSPVLSLVWPDPYGFVTKDDQVVLEATDANFRDMAWLLWGTLMTSTSSNVSISLGSSPADGVFDITVTATDLAGNNITKVFSLAMDSAPPTLSIEGLDSYVAIQPGTKLKVVSSDVFLVGVDASMDDATPIPLTVPFTVDTTGLANGFHVLNLTARDASGKDSSVSYSFFVDAAPPSALIMAETTYSPGQPLVVTARVADDFGVSGAQLCYDRADGSIVTVPMVLSGISYRASIAPEQLHDGMVVYVVAKDLAGNSAESGHLVVHESLAPTTAGDDGKVWFMSSIGWMTLIGSACAVLIFVLFVVSRRREGTIRDLSSEPTFKPVTRIDLELPSSPTPRTRTLRDFGGGVNPSWIATASPEPAMEEEREEPPATRKPSLIDAIPGYVMKTPEEDPPDEEEPIENYGDLIERELIIPLLKNSVYPEEQPVLRPLEEDPENPWLRKLGLTLHEPRRKP